MTSASSNSDAATRAKASPVPQPPSWWRIWQALKGTNFRHLNVPAADLRNKRVLITGGNSGIGYEAALQFARWGAHVVLACLPLPPAHEMRPDAAVEQCRAAAREGGHLDTEIEWWGCDMACLKDVQALGMRWLQTDRPLDLLVNNVGITNDDQGIRFTQDGFEMIHQVNFIAHVLLTMTLLPSIAKAPSPRIVCSTSVMQYFGRFDLSNANRGFYAYDNNKLYFQTWLTELQHRMSNHEAYKHIVIQGVHPGFVNTNIWKSADGKVHKNTWVAWAFAVFLGYIGIDSFQGSLAITNAATAPEWGAEAPEAQLPDAAVEKKQGRGGGKFINRIWEEEPMPQTRHPECRRQIWEFVNKELGLQEKGLLNELGV